MDITPGTMLGRYEIVAPIGAGGMGQVWSARDTLLNRSVAIKVLPAEFAGNVQLIDRLRREAATISQLNHPHICTLYDFGHEDGAAGLDATTQKPITTEGTILGTLPYMAPEQLDGLQADARTDIFAFGAVLYEMVTGKRAFDGKSQSSVIAAIVSAEPTPVSKIKPFTPPVFDHVITKCLSKNPDDRWQSAHDIAEELRWIGEVGSQAGVAAPLLSKRKSRERLVWSSALFAAIAIAALAVYAYVRERNRPAQPALISVLAPKGKSIDQTSPPAISPDGTALAFVLKNDETGTRDLVIRTIDQREPRNLVSLKSVEDYGLPFWSPDGEWIGFFSDGKLKRIRVHGSGGAVAPEDICPVHGMKSSGQGYGLGATWSKAGTILFAPSVRSGLLQVPASGGQPVVVTLLDGKRGQAVHAWPKFVPDGKHFFFIVGKTAKESNEIWYGSLDGSPPQKVTDADALAGYKSPWLVFVREAKMYAQRIDLGTLELSGAATPIMAPVYYDETVANSPSSMSATGTIAYFEAPVKSVELRWVDRSGHTLHPGQKREGISNAQLSPDGTRAASNKFNDKKGARDVVLIDPARVPETNMTIGRMGDCGVPFWADNDHVLYSSDADGTNDVFIQSDDGSAPVPVWRSPEDKYVVDVAPAAGFALIRVDSAHVEIWSLPLRGGTPRPEVKDDAKNSDAAISRDGQWLAFVSNRSGSSEAYVRKMAGGRTDQASNDGATTVSWSRSGSEVFYRNAAGILMSVHVQKSRHTFDLGPPQQLFSLQDMAGDTFDTSADGQRFLVPMIVTRPPSAVTLLAGWQSKVAR